MECWSAGGQYTRNKHITRREIVLLVRLEALVTAHEGVSLNSFLSSQSPHPKNGKEAVHAEICYRNSYDLRTLFLQELDPARKVKPF